MIASVMRFPAAALFCLALAGCGDHLGSYRVDEVRLVETVPAAAIDGRESRPGPALEVALSSPFNLHAAETGPGLYVDADHCPLRDPYRLVAFGPIAEDGSAAVEWKRTEPLQPGPDGQFRYRIYLPVRTPARPPSSSSGEPRPAYDLAAEPRDLCLRLFVPGYNIVPSQSDPIRVEAARVQAAVGRVAGARPAP